jgi:hypothetical protein
MVPFFQIASFLGPTARQQYGRKANAETRVDLRCFSLLLVSSAMAQSRFGAGRERQKGLCLHRTWMTDLPKSEDGKVVGDAPERR